MRLKADEIRSKIKETRDKLNNESNSMDLQEVLTLKRYITRLLRDLKKAKE